MQQAIKKNTIGRRENGRKLVPEGQTEIRRVIEKSVERHTLTSTVVLFSSSALGLLARMPEYAVSMAASGACHQQC